MATYEVMFSEKNKKLLIIQKHKFGFQKKLVDDVERWICTTRPCKSFVKLNSVGAIIESSLEHNHTALSDKSLVRQKCSNSLKRKAVDDAHEAPAKITRREMTEEVSNLLTVNDIRCIRHNITYARSSRRPPLPHSIAQLHDALDAYPLMTVRNENFLFLNDRVHHIVGFSCSTNLNRLGNVDTIFIDGTFKSCPKLFHQLFSIHAIINNVYVPLVFFLLPDKKSSSYYQALMSIKNYIVSIGLTVFVDFETSIHIALENAWPSCIIKGCRFHLGQSWWRKIQTLGLTDTYRDRDSTDGRLLKYFFGLSLLPREQVEDCFCDDLMDLKPNNEKYDKFFDYILETYVAPDSDFPPSMWAECTSSRQRTTNVCEGFHSQLNKMFNAPHPNIFHLADTLTTIQSDTYIKLGSKAAPTINAKEKFVQQQIDEFQNGTITRLAFLKRVCFKFLPAKA